MDAGRSQILAPEISVWNKWLLDAAVDLTLDLLKEDWFARFGADVYLALRRSTTPTTTHFMRELEARLTHDAIWPSRARQGGRPQRVQFTRASELVIPDRRELDDFFSEDSYLDTRLANDLHTVGMAKEHGAKRFTNNSLVRLRCTGLDAYQVATRPSMDEANYRYTDCPKTIASVDWQTRCARAFESDSAGLSKANRADIADSPSTLTAAGTLRPLSNLWFVEPPLAEVCPLPLELRLHPELVASRIYRQLIGKGKCYEPITWLEDVTRKAEQGTLDDAERIAAYRYLISPQRQVKQKALAQLRDTPLLRDHRGAWVAPREITLPTAPGATQLEPVLHLPHPDYSGDAKLAGALGFRRRLDGHDLVAFARYVADHPDRAAPFELALVRHSDLLKQPIIDQLKAIPFLRSSRGNLASPQDLYISNPLTHACLGPEAPSLPGGVRHFIVVCIAWSGREPTPSWDDSTRAVRWSNDHSIPRPCIPNLSRH